MSISIPQQNSVSNYLVPAAGQTHAATLSGIFTATPVLIDWRQFSIDNFPFQPQGVFIDNSAGVAPIIINIQPINYNVSCAAGAVGQFQFPAPDNQTCTITGNGQATIVFVDFPVLPNAGQVNIAGTVDVNVISPSPLPTSPTANAGGLPYQTQEVPIPATALYGTIAAGGTTVTITPTANTNLRKLKISFSDNCTLAVAATILLTATLNGNIIYKENLYFPTTPTLGIGGELINLDFEMLALNVGAAGTLVVTLASALATGIVDINAYFA